MKKIIITLFALIGIFTLIGCGQQNGQNETEEENNNSEVFYGALYDNDGRHRFDTITFKEDGSFTYHIKSIAMNRVKISTARQGNDWHNLELDEDRLWGTYTGDASKNCTLTLTFKRCLDKNDELINYPYDDAIQTLQITDNKFVLWDTEFNYFEDYKTNPVYEHTDDNSLERKTFKPNGIIVLEYFKNGEKQFEGIAYYTGNASKNGILKVFENDETLDDNELQEYINMDNETYNNTCFYTDIDGVQKCRIRESSIFELLIKDNVMVTGDDINFEYPYFRIK